MGADSAFSTMAPPRNPRIRNSSPRQWQNPASFYAAPSSRMARSSKMQPCPAHGEAGRRSQKRRLRPKKQPPPNRRNTWQPAGPSWSMREPRGGTKASAEGRSREGKGSATSRSGETAALEKAEREHGCIPPLSSGARRWLESKHAERKRAFFAAHKPPSRATCAVEERSQRRLGGEKEAIVERAPHRFVRRPAPRQRESCEEQVPIVA